MPGTSYTLNMHWLCPDRALVVVFMVTIKSEAGQPEENENRRSRRSTTDCANWPSGTISPDEAAASLVYCTVEDQLLGVATHVGRVEWIPLGNWDGASS